MIWEVRPCKDRLGHVTSYDICLPQEPGSTGVAVIASVYSGEEVANQIAALWNAASAIDARQSQDGATRLGPKGESAVPERQTPEPSSIAPVQDDDAENIARLFHETYELLAPRFSYTTRKASAVPWEQVPENNRKLMIAVASLVRSRLSRQAGGMK